MESKICKQMLPPDDIDKIRNAIRRATSVADVERLGMCPQSFPRRLHLERALEAGSLNGIEDLLQQSDSLLTSIWDQSKSLPLTIPQSRSAPINANPVVTRKTPRQEIQEEQARKRFMESNQLSDIVIDKLMAKLSPGEIRSSPEWASSPAGAESGKRIVSIECGTCLAMHDGVYIPNQIVRLVLTDFLTDRVLIDINVSLPDGFEAIDLHPNFTGLEESPQEGSTPSEALSKLFEFVSSETVIITENAIRSSQCLGLNHPRWMSIHDVLKVDPLKKKKGEGQFHVRSFPTLTQLLEAYLGEAAHERMKVIEPQARMIEYCLGLTRLIKAVARADPVNLPVLIQTPRRINTIFVTHIPSNWSEEEIRMIIPSALQVDPIEFTLDPYANEWRGETCVSLKNVNTTADAFEKLTACTDVFVGWEWPECGKVNENTLRELATDFGPVVGVRIQEKYLSAPQTIPGKEESRPFGFISMARLQDANQLAPEPRQITKNDIRYHVKISKKPISAFKRVPLGEGEDYIEAFIM